MKHLILDQQCHDQHNLFLDLIVDLWIIPQELLNNPKYIEEEELQIKTIDFDYFFLFLMLFYKIINKYQFELQTLSAVVKYSILYLKPETIP